MGQVLTTFTPRNDLGILDHIVVLPDGQEVLNPFRVVPHFLGSELIFTVRQGGDSEENFAADCQAVQADLERLAALAEVKEHLTQAKASFFHYFPQELTVGFFRGFGS